MILTSSAPGAFGHDHLQQIVRVGCGARVRLTSQSAMQVHPSPDGATAHLQSSYHVDDGADLHCHWHPLIPFADARIEQRIDVNIAGGGYLYWSDALMSGRHARGERWKFASLAHETRSVPRWFARVSGAVSHPTERAGRLAAVGCRRCVVSRNDPDDRSTDRAGRCRTSPHRARAPRRRAGRSRPARRPSATRATAERIRRRISRSAALDQGVCASR